MSHRVIWQLALSASSLVCFVTAISWFRATYKMYQSGEARPFLIPLPIFMYMDIWNVLRRRITDQLPPDFQSRMEKARFESIITGNYLKAFLLLVFCFVAATMAYSMGSWE